MGPGLLSPEGGGWAGATPAAQPRAPGATGEKLQGDTLTCSVPDGGTPKAFWPSLAGGGGGD